MDSLSPDSGLGATGGELLHPGQGGAAAGLVQPALALLFCLEDGAGGAGSEGGGGRVCHSFPADLPGKMVAAQYSEKTIITGKDLFQYRDDRES